MSRYLQAVVAYSLVSALVLADENSPAVKVKVGQRAPEVDAVGADGDAFQPKDLAGKVVLMTFWSDNESVVSHFKMLREIRREFAGNDKFQIVSVRLGGDFEEWLTLMEKQAPLDERFPLRRFYSDSKWWQLFEMTPTPARENPFGAGKQPESFVVGADGRLTAVALPDKNVREAVLAALKKKE